MRQSERAIMPKSIINYPSYSFPFGLAFGIHWGDRPESQAQLSVQFSVDELVEHLLALQKDSPSDKRSIIYSEPLTRAEIQRLIKDGRRARDTVFGADE